MSKLKGMERFIVSNPDELEKLTPLLEKGAEMVSIKDLEDELIKMIQSDANAKDVITVLQGNLMATDSQNIELDGAGHVSVGEAYNGLIEKVAAAAQEKGLKIDSYDLNRPGRMISKTHEIFFEDLSRRIQEVHDHIRLHINRPFGNVFFKTVSSRTYELNVDGVKWQINDSGGEELGVTMKTNENVETPDLKIDLKKVGKFSGPTMIAYVSGIGTDKKMENVGLVMKRLYNLSDIESLSESMQGIMTQIMDRAKENIKKQFEMKKRSDEGLKERNLSLLGRLSGSSFASLEKKDTKDRFVRRVETNPVLRGMIKFGETIGSEDFAGMLESHLNSGAGLESVSRMIEGFASKAAPQDLSVTSEGHLELRSKNLREMSEQVCERARAAEKGRAVTYGPLIDPCSEMKVKSYFSLRDTFLNVNSALRKQIEEMPIGWSRKADVQKLIGKELSCVIDGVECSLGISTFLKSSDDELVLRLKDKTIGDEGKARCPDVEVVLFQKKAMEVKFGEPSGENYFIVDRLDQWDFVATSVISILEKMNLDLSKRLSQEKDIFEKDRERAIKEHEENMTKALDPTDQRAEITSKLNLLSKLAKRREDAAVFEKEKSEPEPKEPKSSNGYELNRK